MRIVVPYAFSVLPRRPGQLRNEIRVSVLFVGGNPATDGYISTAGKHHQLGKGKGVVGAVWELPAQRQVRGRCDLDGSQARCSQSHIPSANSTRGILSDVVFRIREI